MATYPRDLQYTREHEWARIEGDVTLSATVQNRNRAQDRGYSLGEELWCGWQPEDVLMLLD